MMYYVCVCVCKILVYMYANDGLLRYWYTILFHLSLPV